MNLNTENAQTIIEREMYTALIATAIRRCLSAKQRKKVYRSLKNKKICGICGGIAEYTGRNVKAIRIAMVLHSFTIFPAILYFVLGLTNIMEINPKQLKEFENNAPGGNFNG